MNSAEAKINLNESGYVLRGNEVESAYDPYLEPEVINEIKESIDLGRIAEIENFESLKPNEKIKLLEDFTSLSIIGMIAYIDTKNEENTSEANRIVDYYVNLAGLESANEMFVNIYNNDKKSSRLSEFRSADLKLGLTRDLLAVFMKDTVESRAHNIARGWIIKDFELTNPSVKDVLGNIPPLKGYESGIRERHIFGEENKYSIGVWSDLITAAESVDYHTHRELSKEDLTYKLAKVIRKSSKYDFAFSVSTFAEKLAWAQLPEDAQQEIRYRHVKEGIAFGKGLAKFIGKSAPNMYRKAYYATQKSIEEIEKKLVDEPDNALLKNMLDMEIRNYDIIKAKFESNMSPLDKALELQKTYITNPDGINMGTRFWIDAKMGEISWAYNALRNNVSLDNIMKFTVLHRSVEDFGEKFGITYVDRKMLDLFSSLSLEQRHMNFITESEFESLASFYKFGKENYPKDNGVYEDLGKIARFSIYASESEILSLLKDRRAISYLANNEWVLRSATTSWRRQSFGDIFPYDQSIRAQYDWLHDHAESFIQGVDWDSQAKIILHRLRMGVDKNLHDATYWLDELSINPEVINNSIELESELLESLLATDDQKELAKFPSNEKRLSELFSHKRRINFYLNLLRLKKENSSWGSSTDELKEFRDKFPGAINPLRPVRKFNEVLEELKEVADYRKEYSKNLLSWLSTHSDTPRDLLSSAWQSRDLALADGCADNPRAIINWAELNKIRVAIEKGRLNITQQEFDENKDFFMSISRAVSTYNLEKAFKWYKKRASDQILPADTIEPSEGYKFEILSKDDPRGFTVGYDTGCCMTVGGISESCIKAGYRHEDTGFLALYGPDGKIRAQSYWYINPKNPHVIVLDNIEANEGRDFELIIDLYTSAFREYLSKHPELEIYQVNVGTGYTEVNLAGLKKTKAIKNVHNEYTDAHNQRLLYEQQI